MARGLLLEPSGTDCHRGLGALPYHAGEEGSQKNQRSTETRMGRKKQKSENKKSSNVQTGYS